MLVGKQTEKKLIKEKNEENMAKIAKRIGGPEGNKN